MIDRPSARGPEHGVSVFPDLLTFHLSFLHLSSTRIQTSYVTVEPKRRKQQGQSDPLAPAAAGASIPLETTPQHAAAQGSASSPRGPPPSGGRELRRARIVITVKRTESYERWLEENPLQAMIAAADDDEAVDAG